MVSPDRTHYFADHRTNGPGDHKASPDTERRGNGIGLRTCRSNSDPENRCGSQ
jgi:hypothetical protein